MHCRNGQTQPDKQEGTNDCVPPEIARSCSSRRPSGYGKRQGHSDEKAEAGHDQIVKIGTNPFGVTLMSTEEPPQARPRHCRCNIAELKGFPQKKKHDEPTVGIYG
jgi:hypothetical protein